MPFRGWHKSFGSASLPPVAESQHGEVSDHEFSSVVEFSDYKRQVTPSRPPFV